MILQPMPYNPHDPFDVFMSGVFFGICLLALILMVTFPFAFRRSKK